MAGIDPNSPQYQAAAKALEASYRGDDPTNGATHFFAPKAQAALGRPAPAWGATGGQNIGDHRFFGGATDQAAIPPPATPTTGAMPPAPTAGAMPPAAAPNPVHAKIRELLDSPDPYVQRLGQGLAQQVVAASMKPTQPEWKSIGKNAEGVETYGWTDPRTRAVTPYTPPGTERPANSVIPPAPPGVDPKIWRDKYSQSAVTDALPPDPKSVASLRGEVQGLPSYKNLAQAAPVYRSMLEAAGRDNRAADVNMIYGMAKIMDPGSVVRESEMTVAQAIQTLPQQLQATVTSQLQASGRLTPEVRAAIMQEAHSRISAYQGMFDQDANQYRGIAQRGRMHEADVLPSFGTFEKFTPQSRGARDALKNRYGLE
jgi:hypothetical protein